MSKAVLNCTLKFELSEFPDVSAMNTLKLSKNTPIILSDYNLWSKGIEICCALSDDLIKFVLLGVIH